MNLMYHKQKYYNMETQLTIDQILDYCDVPQLFTARDSFDTLYLCLLYDDTSECHYTGIRISSNRISDFLNGKLDLRSIYLYPEQTGEYFEVLSCNTGYTKEKLAASILSEDRLPSEGYYMIADSRENVMVNIPRHDRSLLKELVRKFGWACM